METNLKSTISNSYTDYAKGRIEKFIGVNGKIPNKKDVAKDISVEYLVNAYGSWNNALVQLGVKNKEVRADDTLNSLKELRDKLGTIPNIMNVKEANLNIDKLISDYGSWNEIKKLIKEDFVTIKPQESRKKGLTPEQKLELKTDLGNSIIELTKSLGKIPTVVQLKIGEISISKILKYFGTWKNAREELKLDSLEKDLLVDEIISAQKMTSEKIDLSDLASMGISYNKIKKHFGSWKDAYDEMELNNIRINSVRDEVVDLTHSLERTPTCIEIKECGIPLLFITKETPWKDVKKEWELDDISNEYVIEEIKELSKNMDYTPTLQEIKDNNIKVNKLLKEYNGWINARESIGLPKHSIYKNSFIEETEFKLLDLAEEIGKTPTYSLAKDKGIKVLALKSRYGSWNSALFNLGLRLNSSYTDDAINQLTENIKDLSEKLGRTPTIKDLKEYKIPVNPLRRKYGSLEECFDSIGLIPNILTDKTYKKEKVLDALKNLAKKIGKIPSAKKSKEEGIKINKLISDIGSWKKIKELLTKDDSQLEMAFVH